MGERNFPSRALRALALRTPAWELEIPSQWPTRWSLNNKRKEASSFSPWFLLFSVLSLSLSLSSPSFLSTMASLLSPLVVLLLLLSVAVVVDAVSPTYTLRASDSISQGALVAMSGNGLVSLVTPTSAAAPVLAVATSPGAVTTKYSLSLPALCDEWNNLAPTVSLSGNMFATSCLDSSTARFYVLVYQTMNPSTPFATIPNYFEASLSEDGTILVCTDDVQNIGIFKLSMGTYSSIQTFSSSVTPYALGIAPDASAFAVSDQNSATTIYGWVGNQFVLAPMMPLHVACNTLSISAQSAAGATTIACADPNDPASPVFSLVNKIGRAHV